jgi:hypothetical protein
MAVDADVSKYQPVQEISGFITETRNTRAWQFKDSNSFFFAFWAEALN